MWCWERQAGAGRGGAGSPGLIAMTASLATAPAGWVTRVGFTPRVHLALASARSRSRTHVQEAPGSGGRSPGLSASRAAVACRLPTGRRRPLGHPEDGPPRREGTPRDPAETTWSASAAALAPAQSELAGRSGDGWGIGRGPYRRWSGGTASWVS